MWYIVTINLEQKKVCRAQPAWRHVTPPVHWFCSITQAAVQHGCFLQSPHQGEVPSMHLSVKATNEQYLSVKATGQLFRQTNLSLYEADMDFSFKQKCMNINSKRWQNCCVVCSELRAACLSWQPSNIRTSTEFNLCLTSLCYLTSETKFECGSITLHFYSLNISVLHQKHMPKTHFEQITKSAWY